MSDYPLLTIQLSGSTNGISASETSKLINNVQLGDEPLGRFAIKQMVEAISLLGQPNYQLISSFDFGVVDTVIDIGSRYRADVR